MINGYTKPSKSVELLYTLPLWYEENISLRGKEFKNIKFVCTLFYQRLLIYFHWYYTDTPIHYKEKYRVYIVKNIGVRTQFAKKEKMRGYQLVKEHFLFTLAHARPPASLIIVLNTCRILIKWSSIWFIYLNTYIG